MKREFYQDSRNPSKVNSNRYKECRVLKDVDTGEVLLSTREIEDIPVHPNDIYHRIQVQEVSRLDMLAHKYYKNPLLWWVIAQANDIFDPLTPLEPGTMIRIPPLETLYGNNGILL